MHVHTHTHTHTSTRPTHMLLHWRMILATPWVNLDCNTLSPPLGHTPIQKGHTQQLILILIVNEFHRRNDPEPINFKVINKRLSASHTYLKVKTLDPTGRLQGKKAPTSTTTTSSLEARNNLWTLISAVSFLNLVLASWMRTNIKTCSQLGNVFSYEQETQTAFLLNLEFNM